MRRVSIEPKDIKGPNATMKQIVAELCKICNTRRPRRYCLGVEGGICAICCGTEREVTVSCPYECSYLRDGRDHEKKPAPGPLTHPEVEITDNFMQRNEILLMICTQLWWQVSKDRAGVLDHDLIEAMTSFIQTLKTAASSGLIVSDRPENSIAAGLLEHFTAKFVEWRAEVEKRAVAESIPGPMIRDGNVLKMMVFLERTAIALGNGRPRCRAFYHTLQGWNERLTTGPVPPPQ